MKIGEYEIFSVITGLFRLDGGAMFGVVPKVIWERNNPSDDRNRIQMIARALLLKSKERNILIDTGVGSKFGKKLKDIYAVDNMQFSTEKSLLSIGMRSQDISDVILTHLHFDHAGGCTFVGEEKKLQVTYSNAVHHVQKKHFDWACNPSERDKASFLTDDFMPLFEGKLLKQHDGEIIFDDFITLIPVNGHTRYMQMVKISDGHKTLLFSADLIPMSSHIPLPYIMGYDLFPLLTLEEKREILAKAAENKWYIFFEHDPKVEIGIIGRSNSSFFLESVTELALI